MRSRLCVSYYDLKDYVIVPRGFKRNYLFHNSKLKGIIPRVGKISADSKIIQELYKCQ